MEIPRWVSNTAESTNVQVTEINVKDGGLHPEINPVNLQEMNPKSLPGLELYREINPKSLPEFKVFTDNVDTGRELYLSNGLGNQESNLPIILFGVVVIAVIVYIG